jgi:hypothetical protein
MRKALAFVTVGLLLLPVRAPAQSPADTTDHGRR